MYVYISLSGPAIDLQKMPIMAKQIIFSDDAHFDLGGYVNKQNITSDRLTEDADFGKPSHLFG